MFRLLLPALVPSWNFFDVIAPSPRVEFTLLHSASQTPVDWREFRTRPQRVSLATLARRLLWNPRWNESLFLVSCAERLVDQPTDHSQGEIFKRIAADLAGGTEAATNPWLCFRMVFLSLEGDEIAREVRFQSPPRRLGEIAIR